MCSCEAQNKLHKTNFSQMYLQRLTKLQSLKRRRRRRLQRHLMSQKGLTTSNGPHLSSFWSKSVNFAHVSLFLVAFSHFCLSASPSNFPHHCNQLSGRSFHSISRARSRNVVPCEVSKRICSKSNVAIELSLFAFHKSHAFIVSV